MFSIKLTQTIWRKSILRDLQEKKRDLSYVKISTKTSNHNTLIDIATKTAKPFEIFETNLADRWDPVLFVFLHALHKNDKKIPNFYWYSKYTYYNHY